MPHVSVPRSTMQCLWLGGPGSERTGEVHEKKDANAIFDSCTDKAKPQDPADQVQGPMSSLSVHVGVEGLGQGR